MTTINTVTNTPRLTNQERTEIRRLWKAAGVMDLNYTDLGTRLGVIRAQFQYVLRERDELKRRIDRASEALHPENL